MLGGTLRRPAAERTAANKAKAIGHATYRALLYLLPEDEKWIREVARAKGLDPFEATTDPATPVGVGGNPHPTLDPPAAFHFRARKTRTAPTRRPYLR